MSEPALDPATVAALLESVGGDYEFLGELFGAFAEEAPTLLGGIEAAVTEADGDGLRLAAHTLKSTSASLGGLRLAAVSRQLEQIGQSGALDQAPAQLPALRALVGETVAAMAAAVEGGS